VEFDRWWRRTNPTGSTEFKLCTGKTNSLGTRLLLLPLTLALLGFTSCSGHPATDAQLITAFKRNSTFFDTIARESNVAVQVCPYQNDPDICVPKDVQKLKDRVKNTLSLPVEDIHIERKRGNSLWISIESYGILSTRTSTRGYVYCECSLTPTTKNTLYEIENGIWYRPIGNGWALFIAT
jgi:hypothetical protein